MVHHVLLEVVAHWTVVICRWQLKIVRQKQDFHLKSHWILNICDHLTRKSCCNIFYHNPPPTIFITFGLFTFTWLAELYYRQWTLFYWLPLPTRYSSHPFMNPPWQSAQCLWFNTFELNISRFGHVFHSNFFVLFIIDFF